MLTNFSKYFEAVYAYIIKQHIACVFTLYLLLFIIMISDINKDILSSKIISFADDTRVYTDITQFENSDSLQTDLNYIY